MGTSPMPAPQPCALICLVHNGSLQTPTDSWRLLAGETGRSRVTCRDFGTAITPMGTRCASTCMTPVSLAEKDVNTSGSEGIQIEVMDSAVLTDSLLWKFCREDLESIPREDLERRLETALLINEVLSSQLSDLSKSKGMGLRAGPADLRETFAQTDSSQAPEVEDHYHSLYLQHTSTVRKLELSLEQYQQLCSAICNSRKQQNLLVEEVGECLAGADGAYEEMKSERLRMHKQYQEMRKLLKSNMEMMNTMRERTQRAFRECAESRTLAETALREKEAVDQCCRDLSVSCADRVSQLELDLTTWRRMCDYLQDASVEQHALCGEFEMVAETAESTYHQMAENQQKLRLQMQQELEQSAYGLRDALDKVKRLNCENLQLKSGLATLTDQVAEVEEERDKLMKDNSRYFVDLATTEASLKLSQAALAEKTEKLQTCKAQSKELVDALRENIKSLEEAVDKLKQEKEGMESSLAGSQAHVTHLTKAVKLKDEKLQELSDIQAQAALIADNSEFMEQELKVAREQLMETEGQLSEQVRLLHNRNLECEELRAQCDCFQRNLDAVKKDAREMLLEMGEQMNQAMVEVLALKGQIQDVTRSAETTMKNWQQNRPVTVTGTDQLPPASQTKEEEQETVQSSKECQEGAPCDIRSDHSAFVPIEPTISKPPECDTGASLDIGSCRGAFTRVEPIIPKKTEVEDTLLLTVANLREALLKLLDVQSLTERAMQQQLQDLQQEISKVREQRKATYSKNWLELKSLQDKVGVLETENRRLNRDLQAQVKTNSELEKALSLQDETILEFNKQMETNFKEHTEFLAMQEEVTGLKRELQRTETEAHTYREELTKLQDSEGALDMNWLQEKVQLQHQVRKLREADLQKENDIQELKVKMNRHRAILEQNYHKAEAELAKLDDLIEHVRIVLLSVPDVVASSVELRSLLHYLGEDVGE
ncbi:sperm-associated antigen 5 isoform X2 [Heterodontus francisci]|uniref:sperm-associated antigen 5 isoform X2 n=1 Tax=Heterodontus francisci TaxID=7792 RepID=UPI00355C1F4E